MLTVLCPGCLTWQPLPRGVVEQKWGCDACEWSGSIVDQPRSEDGGRRVVGTHPIGDAKRARAYARCGGRCAYCGKKLSLLSLDCETEHVQSRVAGGRNDDGNLVVACKTCNRRKGPEDAEGFRRWVALTIRAHLEEAAELLAGHGGDEGRRLAEGVRRAAERTESIPVQFACEELLGRAGR